MEGEGTEIIYGKRKKGVGRRGERRRKRVRGIEGNRGEEWNGR